MNYEEKRGTAYICAVYSYFYFEYIDIENCMR